MRYISYCPFRLIDQVPDGLLADIRVNESGLEDLAGGVVPPAKSPARSLQPGQSDAERGRPIRRKCPSRRPQAST